MTATARLRLIFAAAGIVPTAACGATSTRLETTDTTAVVTPETTTTSAGAAASAPADDTTTTTEAPVTVTIAAPAEAPAVPVFVMPEAETEETDAEWWARQPGYEPPAPQGRTTRGDGPYNGWSIPEYIVMCESGGDWNAVNPSGAAGPYQLMPFHLGGDARNFSRDEQHAMAANLWAGGAGRNHWAACL